MDADRLEHSAGIRRVTVGKDEPRSGQTREQAREPFITLHPVERDVVNVDEEVVRINRLLFHQACERRPMVVKMGFLYALRLDLIATEQALNVGSHSLVDQREQPGRRRIKAIVEIEDPIADMSKARVHAASGPKRFKPLIKLKGLINHNLGGEAVRFQRLAGSCDEQALFDDNRLRGCPDCSFVCFRVRLRGVAMSKRFLTTTGCAVVLMFALSACGGGGGGSRPMPMPRPAPTPSPTPTPTPTP